VSHGGWGGGKGLLIGEFVGRGLTNPSYSWVWARWSVVGVGLFGSMASGGEGCWPSVDFVLVGGFCVWDRSWGGGRGGVSSGWGWGFCWGLGPWAVGFGLWVFVGSLWGWSFVFGGGGPLTSGFVGGCVFGV